MAALCYFKCTPSTKAEYLHITTAVRGPLTSLHTTIAFGGPSESRERTFDLLWSIWYEWVIRYSPKNAEFTHKTRRGGRQVPRSPPLTHTTHTRLRPLYQGLKVNPSGFLPSPVKPTGSKADGKLMRVNDRSGMELMTERLAKPSAFLEQETPWSPTLSTFYHSGIDIRAYKNFSNNSEGNRNTELISAEKVSNISNSDQAAVRLSCAASSRHLLQGLWTLS